MARAVRYGAPLFFAFLALDLYVRETLYPSASLVALVAYRTVGAAALIGSLFLFRRADLTMRTVITWTALILTVAVSTLAGLAVELGGLESSYAFTIAYFAVAISTFLPTGWRDTAALVAIPTAAFLAAIPLGVALSPTLSHQFDSPTAVHTYLTHAILIAGLATFAIFSGHIHHRARKALDDAQRLGRYRLKQLLGEGGMNEVWLARDDSLDRDVALKILRTTRDGDFDTQRRRRFEREALATSSLTSPHTVRVFDHGGNGEGVSWIAMEYLRGRDLDQLVLAYGPLDPRRALHFVRQAALSLAEAHEHGLIHRDIKPANLFALSAPGEEDFLKVVDFGIARPLDPSSTALTQVGMLVGTPAFMAPELFLGQPADPRADVYALGATLYHLLTGRPPLEATDLHALLDLAARHNVSPPSTLMASTLPAASIQALDALVASCLRPDRDTRPADASALLPLLDALPVPPWSEHEARAWWSAVLPATAEAPAPPRADPDALAATKSG